MKDLKIHVKNIEGKCPVYSQNSIIYLNQGYKVDLKKTDAICMHSLASILPYYNALSNDVRPVDLGLSRPGGNCKKAFVQCLDPCKYTGGGTVTFEIEILDT